MADWSARGRWRVVPSCTSAHRGAWLDHRPRRSAAVCPSHLTASRSILGGLSEADELNDHAVLAITRHGRHGGTENSHSDPQRADIRKRIADAFGEDIREVPFRPRSPRLVSPW